MTTLLLLTLVAIAYFTVVSYRQVCRSRADRAATSRTATRDHLAGEIPERRLELLTYRGSRS